MTTSTIVSMIIILTIIVGGFVFFLSKALKKEKDHNNF